MEWPEGGGIKRSEFIAALFAAPVAFVRAFFTRKRPKLTPSQREAILRDMVDRGVWKYWDTLRLPGQVTIPPDWAAKNRVEPDCYARGRD